MRKPLFFIITLLFILSGFGFSFIHHDTSILTPMETSTPTLSTTCRPPTPMDAITLTLTPQAPQTFCGGGSLPMNGFCPPLP